MGHDGPRVWQVGDPTGRLIWRCGLEARVHAFRGSAGRGPTFGAEAVTEGDEDDADELCDVQDLGGAEDGEAPADAGEEGADSDEDVRHHAAIFAVFVELVGRIGGAADEED